ncbi:non-canonical purine NTP pyrophosphatase, RdgB/HAM1 family [Pacificimonas flava]|uniref:dITP/XTP pyrophosphatase n=2 Tax=Pacificimonas TaxID=1960290 RepID=A0A219B231_9SPHN|nr:MULTISPECIES: RdgB/HAM1 family non-canonical purine NTP pyrophosphatase [Pacificimonas]MBZ6379657.1 RdgB/HAM1 family non-canonical purine NTP pyrophosphatase [Pacificimonas aurantium]OWV31878.1 non-canonical purine NTP pyrophosphatase, RdgB/HAM1 family [Pacificimonas flava]
MTSRQLEPGPLVIASHNPGKVREIAALLGPFGVEPVSAGDLGLPEPEETEDSFRGNAELKAVAATTASGKPALADDSGLVVDALGGAPGIYSARWGGPEKDFDLAMKRVHEEMTKSAGPDSAHFTCALSLAWPDGHTETFEGHVHGRIVWPPRGNRGFGYDPIFQREGDDITFGEMDPDRKHELSHRAAAFGQLVRACLDR